jgi:hypothetical protein
MTDSKKQQHRSTHRQGRGLMTATIRDMELLARMVSSSGQRAVPMTWLAQETGTQRSYLYRVIERAYRLAGIEPPQETDSELFFPPEIIRLARRFSSIGPDVDSLSRYPVIASGRSLDSIIAQFLIGAASPDLAGALVVPARSGESLEGLLSFRFDVVIGHAQAFDQHHEELRARYSGRLDDLERETLLDWQAVVISPVGIRNCISIEWESGSFAAGLSQASGEVLSKRRVRVLSFAAAFDLARRSVPVRFVAPDCYLSPDGSDDTRLALSTPPRSVADQIIAVFRARERRRLVSLLDVRRWSSFAKRESHNAIANASG